MNPIKLNEAARAVKGEIICHGEGVEIKGVEIDTRQIKRGDLFIAIKGDKVDGHDFLEYASKNGACAALVEKDVKCTGNMGIIKVENTVKALQDLAREYRKKIKCPIVAITGSSGKTTTKDLVKSVLSAKYVTIATKGNKNNHIGLPLTIFDIDENTQSAVLEMGMSGLGEIRLLASIACPDISIITNIGTAHLEQLKSRENILKAKTEIFSTLDKNKVGIINADDDMLSKIDETSFRLYKVGIQSNDLDLKCLEYKTDLNGIKIIVAQKDDSELEEYKFRIPGIHNVYNCLQAISVGKLLGLNQQEIQRGLEDYLPGDNRMDISYIKDGVIINDSYNANPNSMKSALDVLSLYKEKCDTLIAVLGDMFEIGQNADAYHKEVGSYAKRVGVDWLLSVGDKSRYYNLGAEEAGLEKGKSMHFKDKLELADFLNKLLDHKAAVLIKGSRGMKMEMILEKLEQKGN